MDKAQVVGAAINRDRYDIAVEIVEQLMTDAPHHASKWGLGRELLLEFALRDVGKLFIAVVSHRPDLFRRYMEWQRSLFFHRDIPMAVVHAHLGVLERTLAKRLDNEAMSIVEPMIAAGYAALNGVLAEERSALDPEAPLYRLAHRFLELIRERRAEDAIAEIVTAVEEGLDVTRVYLELIQPVQQEVGRLWQRDEMSVLEEHYATDAGRTLMARLRANFAPIERRDSSVLTACLGGELHDLGAHMVHDFFTLAGFQTYFTGANTPHDQILTELRRSRPGVLALSATMTLQVRLAYDLIDLVRREVKPKIHVIVGGYAFNQNPGLWRDIGADSFSPDARGAIDIVSALV